MENIKTWTPLHHEINNCHANAQEIANVLQKNGHQDATLERVQSIIQKHQELMTKGWCGPSLPARIVNEFGLSLKA